MVSDPDNWDNSIDLCDSVILPSLQHPKFLVCDDAEVV